MTFIHALTIWLSSNESHVAANVGDPCRFHHCVKHQDSASSEQSRARAAQEIGVAE